MSLVVATEPTSLAVVYDNCERIEAWAETCTDVAELRDYMNKCSAMSEYMRLTSTEGIARIEAAKRHLEVRVGVLLGQPRQGQKAMGGGPLLSEEDVRIAAAQRSDFRAMAADPETVEEVIAASSDDAPPTRKKVMDAIKSKRAGNDADSAFKKLHRHDAEQRIVKAREMAAAGYTSRQIADTLGIRVDSFTDLRKRNGFDVPADAVVGKTIRHNNDRIAEQAIGAVEGAVMALDLIGDPAAAGLDPDQIDAWVISLTRSISALTRFNKHIKEMTR